MEGHSVQSFDRSVMGIGVLADPVRRQLYRFVCSRTEPVTRDQAAEAVSVARKARAKRTQVPKKIKKR